MRARPALLLALSVVAGCGSAGDDPGSGSVAAPVERGLIVDYEVDGESGSVTTALPATAGSCAEAARSGTSDGRFAIPLPDGDAVVRPYEGPGMYEGAVIVDASLESAKVIVAADGSGVAHLVGEDDVTAQWRCVD